MVECITNVSEAMAAAAPLIGEEIQDRSITFPSFFTDLPRYLDFPNGAGSTVQDWSIRAKMPELESDFSRWVSEKNDTGCDPCATDCGKNSWTTIGGHAIEREVTSMMYRDYETPVYCIKELQTKQDFNSWVEKIVEFHSRRIAFIKEFNIVQNAIRQVTVKAVVDGGGIKIDRSNPLKLPVLGSTAQISTLNFNILARIYGDMLRNQNQYKPFDMKGGLPVFGISSTPEVFNALWRSDPATRTDINFSSQADNLLSQYGVFESVKGMFYVINNVYAPKYNRDPATGQLYEVKPFANDFPAEFGTFTDYTEEYNNARYVAVDIFGMSPIDIYVRTTERQLPGGMQFGSEPVFFNTWKWIRSPECQDPFGREGKFVTTGNIGINLTGAKGMIRLIVDTGGDAALATYPTFPGDPEDEVVSTNQIPEVEDCPTPCVANYIFNKVTGTYIFETYVPVNGVAEDPIKFEINNGGYVIGELVAISSDQLAFEVSFPDGTILPACDAFTRILLDNSQSQLGCTAKVVNTRAGTGSQQIITLDTPTVAITANDTFRGTLSDGTTLTLTVVSANLGTLEWTVTGLTAIQAAKLVCVCVTGGAGAAADCPSCDTGALIEACVVG